MVVPLSLLWLLEQLWCYKHACTQNMIALGRSQRFPWKVWGITAQTQRALETKLPYNCERGVWHLNVLTLVGTWWHVGRIGQCNVSSPILINSKTTGMKIIPSVETSNCAFGKKKKTYWRYARFIFSNIFGESRNLAFFHLWWTLGNFWWDRAKLNLTDWISIFVLFLPKRFAQSLCFRETTFSC